MNKYINIGTLNARGIMTEEEREILANDAIKYNLDILSVTETHLTEDIHKGITVKDENGKTHTYILYATTKTGILIRKELQPLINKVNERIYAQQK